MRYTSASFATVVGRGESEQHLGYIGPLLRMRESERLKVHVRNGLSGSDAAAVGNVSFAIDGFEQFADEDVDDVELDRRRLVVDEPTAIEDEKTTTKKKRKKKSMV